MDNWIYRRKSCRKYQERAVDKAVLVQIQKTKETFQFPHHQQFDWAAVVITEGAAVQRTFNHLMSRYVSVYAPHYLLLSCAPQDNDAFLIGFLGEHLVKGLTEIGIGTCWVGHSMTKNDAVALGMPEHHEYKILIAFGYPESQEDLADQKHKRKSLEQLGYSGDPSDLWLYTALQLAPSAVNTQPWHLEHREGQYHYLMNKKHLLSGLLKGKNAIDLGIGFYHIYDAIKGRDLRMSWDFGKSTDKSPQSVLHFKFFE